MVVTLRTVLCQVAGGPSRPPLARSQRGPGQGATHAGGRGRPPVEPAPPELARSVARRGRAFCGDANAVRAVLALGPAEVHLDEPVDEGVVGGRGRVEEAVRSALRVDDEPRQEPVVEARPDVRGEVEPEEVEARGAGLVARPPLDDDRAVRAVGPKVGDGGVGELQPSVSEVDVGHVARGEIDRLLVVEGAGSPPCLLVGGCVAGENAVRVRDLDDVAARGETSQE